MDKNISNNAKKYFSLLLILLILITTGCDQVKDYKDLNLVEREIDEEFDNRIKNNDDFAMVAENKHLELYINGKTAEIKVFDKISGNEIYSNPQTRNNDRIAVNPESQERLTSQLNVEFRDADGIGYMNSFTDSIKLNQISYEEIKDGIRVNYVLGRKPVIYLAPQILSIERRNFIRDQLDENDQRFFDSIYRFMSLDNYPKEDDKALYRNRYPILIERDVYIAGLSADPTAIGESRFASSYIMNKIQDVFIQIGYTLEDLERDSIENKATLVPGADKTVSLSLVYQIVDDSLVATVPRDSIYFNRSQIQVTNINVLPFLGCADEGSSGYIFVPDGSGALINLNNNKSIFGSYEKLVYDKDKMIYLEGTRDYNTTIRLPVFGIKEEDKAFLGIITKGDGASSIIADISGRTSQNNTVSAKFTINTSSNRSNQGLSSGLGRKFQTEILKSDLQLKYYFLNNNDATYVGMAKKYRQYLIENNSISPRENNGGVPLDISIIQSTMTKKSILGIPRDSILPLTTFEQTQQILQELLDKGVENAILRVNFWSNNSDVNSPFNKIKFINEIGGQNGFAELIEFTGERGIEFYPIADFQYVSNNSMFSGFNTRRDSARMLDNTLAYDLQYNVNTQSSARNRQKSIVSVSNYSQMINSFLNRYKNFNNSYLSLGSMGSDLNADYKNTNTFDRQQSLELINENIIAAKEQGYSIGVDSGNVYTLSGASIVFNSPVKSSKEYIFDHCVPFYQIVVGGIIPYTGPFLNNSSDFDEEVLRLLETGSYPSFQWMYERNDVLNNTRNNYFSINYKEWLNRAVETYEIINDAFGGSKVSYIENHEIIDSGVVRVSYDNGTVIFINYNNTPYVFNGRTIQPRNYIITKGDR